MTAPAVDLDKWEALANEALKGCSCHERDDDDFHEKSCALIKYEIPPAVVLQWVAETRAKEERLETALATLSGHAGGQGEGEKP